MAYKDFPVDLGLPWHVADYSVKPVGGPGIGSDRFEVFVIAPQPENHPDVMKRIVACVNACADVRDPAVAIQMAREALTSASAILFGATDQGDPITDRAYQRIQAARKALGA